MRLLLAVPLLALAGCYAPDRTIPERSALDMQAEAEAIRGAVERLDLRALGERRLRRGFEVVVSGLRATDREWVRSCLEERLARNGFQVVRTGANPEGEQEHLRRGVEPRATAVRAGSPLPTTTLEAVVVYAGRDGEQSLIGVPLFIPGIPASFGALSLYSSATTTGRARLGLRVWEEQRLVAVLPEVQESKFHKTATFLTIFGPFRSTDIDSWEEPGREEHEPEDPYAVEVGGEVGAEPDPPPIEAHPERNDR